MDEYSTLRPVSLWSPNWKIRLLILINRLLYFFGVGIGLIRKTTTVDRYEGLDWPVDAETMIGMKRLNHLNYCLDTIRRENIPGDLLEAGVWRGGAVIFMKAYCDLYGLQKKVFAADSFKGLPEPRPEFTKDSGSIWHEFEYLSVGLHTVQENFRKYGVSTTNVEFIEGFFEESLLNTNVKELALLRLDGDMYSSTWDTLINMYPKVVNGGFIVIDDYSLQGAQAAVSDFFEKNQLNHKIYEIDSYAAYFRKS
jgi:O-methyltransferase